MIFDKHAHLKYKYGNRHFWCRGYYVDTVGRYEGAIKEYIRNQLHGASIPRIALDDDWFTHCHQHFKICYITQLW